MKSRSIPAMDVIARIPQQVQSQCSLTSQLLALREAANRLGLYDAADALRVAIPQPVHVQRHPIRCKREREVHGLDGVYGDS
jgi:hypothetical protein